MEVFQTDLPEPDARVQEVVNELFDLFIDLDATEEQLDFPIIYTNAREGIAKMSLDDPSEDLRPLFEAIIKHTPHPSGDPEGVLQLLVANLDDFLHRHEDFADVFTHFFGLNPLLNVVPDLLFLAGQRVNYEPLALHFIALNLVQPKHELKQNSIRTDGKHAEQQN